MIKKATTKLILTSTTASLLLGIFMTPATVFAEEDATPQKITITATTDGTTKVDTSPEKDNETSTTEKDASQKSTTDKENKEQPTDATDTEADVDKIATKSLKKVEKLSKKEKKRLKALEASIDESTMTTQQENANVDNLLSTTGAEGKDTSYYDEELAKVEKKKKELARLQTLYSGDKDKLKQEMKNISGKIQVTEQKLDKINNHLKEKNAEVQAQETELVALHKDIEQTKKDLKAREQDFRERIKSMHEQQNPTDGILSVILTSDSIGSMVNRVLSYTKIAKSDNSVIEEYLALSDKLETQKKEAETKLAQLQTMVDELTSIKTTQVAAKEELAELKQQKSYESMVVGDVLADLDANLSNLETSEEHLSDKKLEATQLEELENRVAKERQEAEKAKEIYLSVNAKKIVQAKVDIEEEVAQGKMFIMPTTGRVSSGFGPRVVFGEYGMHYGVDFANPVGTPIYASAAGEIINAKWTGGYGNAIYIQHHIDGKDFITEYGHLSAYAVKLGDTVEQGQLIGLMGNTGRSTGPHLHFGLQENATHWDRVTQAVDPFKYLGKATDENTLKAKKEAEAKEKAEKERVAKEEAEKAKEVKASLKELKAAAEKEKDAKKALKKYKIYLEAKKEARKVKERAAKEKAAKDKAERLEKLNQTKETN